MAERTWFVTTGPLDGHGRKVAGPFETDERALLERNAIEVRERRTDLWIDCEPLVPGAGWTERVDPEGGDHPVTEEEQ